MLVFELLSSLYLMGGVLIPFYLSWGGLNMTQVLVLQSVFMLALFVLEVPTGAVADRFGRRTALVLSGLVTGLAVLVYTAAPRFELFLVGELLFALGAAFGHGADDALLVDSLKVAGKEHELGRHVKRLRTVHLVALAVGSVLGSLLAQFTDVRLPFLLTAVPVLLSVAAAAALVEPPHSNGGKNSMLLMREGLGHFRRNRQLQLLALETAAVGTVGYFVLWLNQAALMQAGVPVAFFGLLQAALAGAEVAVLTAMPRLERQFGTHRVAQLFPLLTGLGLLGAGLLLTAHGPAALLAGSLLLAGGFGLTQEAFLQPSMQRLMPSEQRATVGSTVAAVGQLGRGVANPFVGFAADLSLSATLMALGGLGLAVALFSPARKVLQPQERRELEGF